MVMQTAVAARDLKKEIRRKYNITMSTHGITRNPPVEVQKEMGFTHVAESRRNAEHHYDILNPNETGTNGSCKTLCQYR